jgi:hypothetical protein
VGYSSLQASTFETHADSRVLTRKNRHDRHVCDERSSRRCHRGWSCRTSNGRCLKRTCRTVTVAAIGITQTLAWGSSYYLPAILADDMARAIGVPRAWVFAAFSASLLLAAVLGPSVGRAIDRRGGSGVLVASNVVLAAGLVGLSLCADVATLVFAWAVRVWAWHWGCTMPPLPRSQGFTDLKHVDPLQA